MEKIFPDGKTNINVCYVTFMQKYVKGEKH